MPKVIKRENGKVIRIIGKAVMDVSVDSDGADVIVLELHADIWRVVWALKKIPRSLEEAERINAGVADALSLARTLTRESNGGELDGN